MAKSARDRILDAAEARARTFGYNGFSFSDIASDAGVETDSVRALFPTRGILAVELARRYRKNTGDFLGDPGRQSAREALDRVITLFRNALTVDDRMCLCGLFAAERDALPGPVSDEVRSYFDMITGFLEKAFGPDWSGEPPVAILARLEGALLVARSMEDHAIFDRVTEGLEQI